MKYEPNLKGHTTSYTYAFQINSAHKMCDGLAHGSSVGLVDWATVCLVVIIDVDTHALHRSCLRHRSMYSIMAGKLCAKYSAAKPHGQFDQVCR